MNHFERPADAGSGYRSVPTEVTRTQIEALADFLLSIPEPAPTCERCGEPANHEHNGRLYCELCRGCDLD